MKLELFEQNVAVGQGNIPGPKTQPAETVVANIQRGSQDLAAAIQAQKWQYAESLLTNMLQQVRALSQGAALAPSIEKPSFKV